jgi:hypothetical protein
MTWEPTTHDTISGKEAQTLPVGSIVLPTPWPNDGRAAFPSPILRSAPDMWRTGTGTVGTLDLDEDQDERYMVLYVPAPSIPDVGELIQSEHQLRLLPTMSVIMNSGCWSAQLEEDPNNPDVVTWCGPMTSGEDLTHEKMWFENGGGLTLLWKPEVTS